MQEVPTTIAQASQWLRSGRTTSVALTAAMLERSYALQATLSAFYVLLEESALAAARQADAERAAGTDRGPLHGIPIAVKDNILMRDAPTTAGSRVLGEGWGAGVDATVVRKLREAGAVITGKLALYEFALGFPDPAVGLPIARNPWNTERIPGGSSSGAAAAVAAGLVLGALGTDTGGSIRVPAAYCGISGLRPTYGRVSNFGSVPCAESFDTIGPMARSAEDCALILDAIAGFDLADGNTVALPPQTTSTFAPETLEGVRIGIPDSFYFTAPGLNHEVKDAVLNALAKMVGAGATQVDVSVPYLEEAYAAWMTITFAESFAYHEPMMRNASALYGQGARRSILNGLLLTAADYLQARRMQRLAVRACERSLADVDVIVVPCTAYVSPVVENWDHFSTPSFTGMWSLLGYPSLSVPCGFDHDGMPIGMQMIAKPFEEKRLFGTAAAYQRLTEWHLQVPEIANGSSTT